MVGTEPVTTMDNTDYRTVAKHLGHIALQHNSVIMTWLLVSAVKAHTKLQELAKLTAWVNIDTLLSIWPLSNKAPPSAKLCIPLQQQLKNIIDKWLQLINKK